MSDEREASTDDRALEDRVEVLAREIVKAINAGEVGTREQLRDAALSLLRDEVQIAAPPPPEAGPVAAGAFNPFGIGIPLCLMGAVMVFLFPPVGLLLFAVAALMIAWGVGSTLLARG